jgi:formylglycine-generating enzyme required for sulfatase activity
MTALEAASIHWGKNEHRVMLLGSPGSGKSTFVNHLAYCLAGAALADLHDDEQQRTAWLERLPGWTHGVLLPIRIILRDFAAFEDVAKAQKGSPQLLLAFLQTMLEELGCAEAFPLLVKLLREGKALLLLDGFDEVVGKAVLPRVTESITSTAQSLTKTPLLVTCRILDYQAERQRQLPGFAIHTLADFSDEQVKQFVQAWYGELANSGRRSPPQARADAAALTQAISSRSELRDLARLPLLATVMALVHTNLGTLPDARALLYNDCIELLLLRWRQQQGSDLLTRLDLDDFKSDNLLALMARLGFAAHEQAEHNNDTNADKPADLQESRIIVLMSEFFAAYAPSRRYALAQIVFDALTQGNGLLLQRGPGVYAFPHRTFQEFLAGYHLLRQPNYNQHCLARSAQAHWHEALLLMVGYQVLAGGEYDKPLGLAEKLLKRSPAEHILAGEMLDLMGRERLAEYDLFGTQGQWRRTYTQLLRLSVQGTPPEAPAVVRVRAGLVAGKLTSYDNLDTTPPIFDPRLPLALVGTRWQQSGAWQQALQRYWCSVESGAFWYGAKQDKLQQMHLDYNFQIARFPVTNAEYARFIDAGGYQQQEWWTEQGWIYISPKGERRWDPKELEGKAITQPRLWEHSAYNNPAQPVVGVSWYEAAAYCRWLSTQTGLHIRLPTSLEWERAARHTDQRPYPWGTEKPTPERANYDATEIGGPSPVGCFPVGGAECGAQDMAGNVLEWLATPYGKPEQEAPEKDFTPWDSVLFTLSAWGLGREELLCGSRGGDSPYFGDLLLGFRVLRSLRSSV